MPEPGGGVMILDLPALDLVPAARHPELLAEHVHRAVLDHLPGALVAPIDPELADTAAFCARYGVPPANSANIVLLQGKRGGQVRRVACMALATCRVDVNHFVRQHLDVRRVSFASMDEAVAASAMAYGAITPVGSGADWPVWVDEAVTQAEWVCVGAGVRHAKLFLAGADLLRLPYTRRAPGLAQPTHP